MIDERRKEWLRGAYQDRIREIAMWLSERWTFFDADEVAQALQTEYDYLHELTAEDHGFLREETARQIEDIVDERGGQEFWDRHALIIARTSAAFKMESADRAYHLDQSAFDKFVEKAFDQEKVVYHERATLKAVISATVWSQLQHAHGELRASAYAHLRSLNPSSIASDAIFSMDIGWSKLLQRAATRIESYPTSWRAKLISAKEKLGCCIISVDCDYSSPGCRSEIERLREEIRLTSLSACEICGQPGRLRLGGFAKTVCDAHVGVLGALREDDGTQADPYAWEDDYRPESAEFLKDMDPVRPRPTVHVLGDDSFGGVITRQIEADMKTTTGREHELLFAFCGALEVSVTRAAVRPEDVESYVREEVDSWASVQPLSDADKEYLHGYLRDLIGAEYERVKDAELEHFLDDFGDGFDTMQEAQRDGVFDDLGSTTEDDEDETRS